VHVSSPDGLQPPGENLPFQTQNGGGDIDGVEASSGRQCHRYNQAPTSTNAADAQVVQAPTSTNAADAQVVQAPTSTNATDAQVAAPVANETANPSEDEDGEEDGKAPFVLLLVIPALALLGGLLCFIAQKKDVPKQPAEGSEGAEAAKKLADDDAAAAAQAAAPAAAPVPVDVDVFTPLEDKIGRMTHKEFENLLSQLMNELPRTHSLAFHFTDEDSLKFILAPTSVGIRASALGQLGGGLSVCSKSPPELGWEPFCGGDFREQVGKALWGTKWEEVSVGGPHEKKLDVLLVLQVVTENLLDETRILPERPDVTILPRLVLVPKGKDFYFPREYILRVYHLNQ